MFFYSFVLDTVGATFTLVRSSLSSSLFTLLHSLSSQVAVEKYSLLQLLSPPQASSLFVSSLFQILSSSLTLNTPEIFAKATTSKWSRSLSRPLSSYFFVSSSLVSFSPSLSLSLSLFWYPLSSLPITGRQT